MAYHNGASGKQTYIDVSQPLYGLGGGIPSENTSGWGAQRRGTGAYELRGMGAYETRGAAGYETTGIGALGGLGSDDGSATAGGPTLPTSAPEYAANPLLSPSIGPDVKAPAGYYMPHGINGILFFQGGQQNPLANQFLADWYGKMVDANAMLFQGVACDNVAGAPGSSVPATQAFAQWAASGYFVVIAKLRPDQTSLCANAATSYGTAKWTAYRMLPKDIGKLVGASDVYIFSLPYGEPQTAAGWAKYAQYLPKEAGGTMTNSLVGSLTTGQMVLGAVALAAVVVAFGGGAALGGYGGYSYGKGSWLARWTSARRGSWSSAAPSWWRWWPGPRLEPFGATGAGR